MKNLNKAILPIKSIISMTLMFVILGTFFGISKNNYKNIEISKENLVEIQNMQVAKIARESIQTTSRSNMISRTLNQKTEEVETNEIQVSDIQEIIDVISFKTIEQVTISINMDLTKRTGLTKQDFKTLISTVKQDTSKFFYDNAEKIYDVCEKYELNEIFFCGLISAESGWDIASNHRKSYNYISLMLNGNLIKFNSVEQGLEAAARALHVNYLTPGGSFYFGKTLSAVKTRFCPASSTWVNLVYGRMSQIL